MFENYKFIVVEDKDADRVEVLTQLADANFTRANLLAKPATYQDALEAITDHQNELDVVFLDLNLPRDATDARPEKGHGRNLLNFIHRSLNPGANIRVVVVSGEDLLDGFNDQNMYELFAGTLVGIAQKSSLAVTLKRSLRQLRRDPLAQRIRRAKMVEVADLYELVVDAAQPAAERLKAARSLAIRLVRYEVDHYQGRVDATIGYADRLSELIRDHIESRFAEDNYERRRLVKVGAIQSDGGWGAFLWRGATVTHLRALNSYRNGQIHLAEQPYVTASPNSWQIPRESLEAATSGRALGVVAEAIVRDLLEWYLPWHEQVYQPWREKQP